MSPTALITGAGGYVGLATANRLTEQGWKVYATGRGNPPAGLHPKTVMWIKHDLTQKWENTPFDVDVVINTAGAPGITPTRGPSDLWKANVDTVLNLSSLAHSPNLIHCSTVAFLDVNTTPIINDDSLTPDLSSPYGRSKYAGEIATRDSGYDNVCSVRLSAVAGTAYGSVDSDTRRLLPKLVEHAETGQTFTVFGGCSNEPSSHYTSVRQQLESPACDDGGFRDMVHVGDVADAFLLLARKNLEGKLPETVVCGSGNATFLWDMAAAVGVALNTLVGFKVNPDVPGRSWLTRPEYLTSNGWTPARSTLPQFVEDAVSARIV